MKAVRLNLEDRQAWQKLQHVLTSLASDYMDLVAAEQTELKFEQQVLSIAFTLITSDANRDRLNEFTQNIDRYFNRLQLVGVRRIEWEFYVIGEAVPLLAQGRDIPFIAAPKPLPSNALVRDSRQPSRSAQSSPLARGKFKAGNLVRRFRGWLVNPKTIQAARTASRLTIRDPKGALAAIGTSAIAKFNDTIQWVDTFPWETWTKEKAQQIKRRHQRNLVRAVIEDVLILGVMLIALYWLTEVLSGPSINLALMPKQHHDTNITNVQYRCGNPAISLKNYICLGRGMSYDQVASILGSEGKPLGIDHNVSDRAVIVSWSSGEMNMNVTFLDDKLVSRAYRQFTASK
ncbi:MULTISPECIES: hypothetical protein [unclassified Pseudanabaena]|uniref:hypothetical protein n=1 Tax=unclassified Pseudanabaena TaxID=2593292 RepID=UPI0006D7ED9C|nr:MULTISPECIES: hypothetical protein [unclassified Pseudanabaena]TYQ31247.1 hypothetical protein PseudUWO310_04315 [Pseudanabaena sp. UWO310]